MNKIIKQDINFLEYPLWSISDRHTKEITTWIDNDGYQFKCMGKPPNKVDMIYLYYILVECQNNNFDRNLTLTKYQILNGCGNNSGKKDRLRLEESLSKWTSVLITFKGSFYGNKEYETMDFGIINQWDIQKDDKKIRIQLNDRWIEKIKQSHFFKYISFTQMKTLKSPLALRLYEILIKTFYKRREWEIDIHKLAEKIPMKQEYVSDIIIKVKPAIKRINDKTDLKIKLEVIKTGRNIGKFIFKKTSKPIEKQGELFNAPNEKENTPKISTSIPDEISNLIDKQYRTSSKLIINEIIKNKDVEIAKKCILYANTHRNIKNYGALVRKIYDNQLYLNGYKKNEEIKLYPGLKLKHYKKGEYVVQDDLSLIDGEACVKPYNVLRLIEEGKFVIIS